MTPAPWMNAAPGACLALRCGPHRARVAPAAGGRVLSWSTDLPDGLRNWLVPITDPGWPAHAWPKGGLFPLAPFSNRVRDAQLHWRDQVIPLDPLPGTRHALHGQAQGMAWTVEQTATDHVVLMLEHPEGLGGWPWAWRLRQTIRLADQGLRVELTLGNEDRSDMPAGLGLHPYFTAQSVDLSATTEWVHEEELARYPQPATERHWERTGPTWTRFLSGWDGTASIAWPSGPGLTLRTQGPLGHMVLHCNAGRYLCVEPATHVCDGFNLAAAGYPGTGTQVLAPGESLSIGMALDVGPAPR